jgi:hypothetical protein
MEMERVVFPWHHLREKYIIKMWFSLDGLGYELEAEFAAAATAIPGKIEAPFSFDAKNIGW